MDLAGASGVQISAIALLFAILCELATVLAQPTPSCSAVSRGDNIASQLFENVPETRQIIPLGMSHSFHRERTSGGIRETRSSVAHGILKTEFKYGDVTVTTLSPRVVSLGSTENILDSSWDKFLDQPNNFHFWNPSSERSYLEEVLENLSFAVSEYESRKGWPDEFLKRLVKVGLQYAFLSSFVTVRDAKGGIVGSMRVVDAPFQSQQSTPSAPFEALRRLSWSQEFRDILGLKSDFGLHTDRVELSERLKSGILGRLFPSGRIDLFDQSSDPANDFRRPGLWRIGRMTFVSTPMEEVLPDQLGRRRDTNLSEPGRIIEPGNFALSDGAGSVAPLLYLHFARIALSANATELGYLHGLLTYAEKGESSHRLYRGLSLGVLDERTGVGGPTSRNWQILGGDPTVVYRGVMARLRVPESERYLFAKFRYQVEQNERNFLKSIRPRDLSFGALRFGVFR